MKRTLIVGAALTALLTLTACESMNLSDGGRYDGYRQSTLDLAKEAQLTERIRLSALASIAATADDRTRDRIVSELSGQRGAVSGNPGVQLQAPSAPTNMGIEALRALGPGAIGLIGQGIGAWSANQADQLATQRNAAANALINSTVQGALSANTGIANGALGVAGGALSVAEGALAAIPAQAGTTTTPTTVTPATGL